MSKRPKHLAKPTHHTIVVEEVERILSRVTGNPGFGWGKHRSAER